MTRPKEYNFYHASKIHKVIFLKFTEPKSYCHEYLFCLSQGVFL